MVFTTLVQFVRSRGPDEFWRKRKIFKLSAHFIGRRRNCYSIAIRNVHRALAYATKGRRLKKLDMSELWKLRTSAACEQYHTSLETFTESMTRSNVLLSRKTIADLAIWEPRSFEALVKLSRERAAVEGYGPRSDESIVNKVYGLPLLIKS